MAHEDSAGWTLPTRGALLLTRLVESIGRHPMLVGVLRYACSVGAVVAAGLLARFLNTAGGFGEFSVFLIAAGVVGWFLGVGPGLLSTGLATLALDYFFVAPMGTVSVSSLAGIGLPLAVLLAIVLLASSVHQQLRLSLEEAKAGRAQAAALYQHLREESDERTQLLAGIAHDLRHPIGIIQIESEMLKRTLTDEQSVARVQGVDLAAGQLSRAVAELLDLARLRHGEELSLRLSTVDVAGLLRKAVNERQATTDRHFVLSVSAGQFSGSFDATRLERVFHNLLDNALKYSSGDIVVSLTEEHTELGAWARVSVADGGIGIPEVDLPRIFEGFYRGGNVGRMSGMGVGLMTAKQIIQQHQGTIEVASEAGNGTTFTVLLPLQSQEMGSSGVAPIGPAVD